MNIEHIQQALHDEQLDGWLFYDFRKSNPIAYQVLALPTQEMYSRRWFYFVPAQGMPVAVISAVEPHTLRSLPGQRLIFRTWQEMHAHVHSLFRFRYPHRHGILTNECHPLYLACRRGHGRSGALLWSGCCEFSKSGPALHRPAE